MKFKYAIVIDNLNSQKELLKELFQLTLQLLMERYSNPDDLTQQDFGVAVKDAFQKLMSDQNVLGVFVQGTGRLCLDYEQFLLEFSPEFVMDTMRISFKNYLRIIK